MYQEKIDYSAAEDKLNAEGRAAAKKSFIPYKFIYGQSAFRTRMQTKRIGLQNQLKRLRNEIDKSETRIQYVESREVKGPQTTQKAAEMYRPFQNKDQTKLIEADREHDEWNFATQKKLQDDHTALAHLQSLEVLLDVDPFAMVDINQNKMSYDLFGRSIDGK